MFVASDCALKNLSCHVLIASFLNPGIRIELQNHETWFGLIRRSRQRVYCAANWKCNERADCL